MIINFNELTIPSIGSRLEPSLSTRYLKSIGEDMEDYWVHGKDLLDCLNGETNAS